MLADVGAGRLGERQLSELSGGELQRVVLARALIRSPDLLVLDEPVRGVDYAGEAELYTLIGRLRTERGFGVLLVSHDLHVVMAQSDRVDLPQPACVLLGRAAVGGAASRVCAPVRPAGGARLRPLPPPATTTATIWRASRALPGAGSVGDQRPGTQIAEVPTWREPFLLRALLAGLGLAAGGGPARLLRGVAAHGLLRRGGGPGGPDRRRRWGSPCRST